MFGRIPKGGCGIVALDSAYDSYENCRLIAEGGRGPVIKPAGAGRYKSGHGRCQTCDVWLGHMGCHVKDGSSTRMGSVGWFYNCYNFRVRRTPRNKKYKKDFMRNQSSSRIITNKLISFRSTTHNV